MELKTIESRVPENKEQKAEILKRKSPQNTTRDTKFYKIIVNNFHFFFTKLNYLKQIKKLKKAYQNRKIRVAFYITESSKWCYQSLYDEFEKDEHFYPFVLVGVLKEVHKGKDKTRNALEETFNFFKSRNIRVEYAYNNHKYISFKQFEPDIVFYEQPWEIPAIFQPHNVSKFALTCYCDYGFEFFNNRDNYKQNFHKLLWTFFVDNRLNINRYESYRKNNKDNCVAIGYPKLDVYFNQICDNTSEIWRNPDRFKIIYAPHHSFESDGLQLATFKENGKFILDFAKQHPETTWVFKPHPRFKFALMKNKIMNETQIKEYYAEWGKIGNIYTQGAYFDIFKTSDLLLTDCASFLGEYMPTSKPIIRMINKNAIDLNILGELISSGCYETHNNEELEETLKNIITEKKDYKSEQRKEVVSKIIDYNQSSSNKLLNYLKSVLEQ